MKRSSMFLVQAALMLFGVAVLVGMLWEPQTEGVNANKTLMAIYLDPFVAYAYLGSIPFFVGLYQAVRFLGFVGAGESATPAATRSLRTIRYCALVVVACIVGAELWIMRMHGDDDAAGVFALGILATIAGLGTAAATVALERSLRRGGLTPASR